MVTMDNDNTSVIEALSGAQVLGQDLANVSVLRLDRLGGAAPGNKAFKLQPVLASAAAGGVGRVLSFGGPWSNHLHALAACGADRGLETVGFVRGAEQATAMLEDARRWGLIFSFDFLALFVYQVAYLFIYLFYICSFPST